LLYALLLLKNRYRDSAVKRFEELRLAHPTLPLPSMAIIWARFDRTAYASGIGALEELVAKTPVPKKPGESYPEDARRLFRWIGQLREFAAVAAVEPRRPSADVLASLDAAVEKHGDEARRAYKEGRDQSRAVSKDFDQKIADATTDADKIKYKIDRRQPVHYAVFPFDQFVRQICAGLDQ